MDWINIKDERPKKGQRVIYYFKETGIDIGRFSQEFIQHGVKGNTFHGHGGWLTDDVTHWMPLPEVPKD